MTRRIPGKPTGRGVLVHDFIFLIGQKTALNQRSGIVLEVQIQIFGARVAQTRQSFHFLKIQGSLNINIFDENRHEASLYIKERTQKNKFEI